MSNPSARPEGQKTVVVVYGDSLTPRPPGEIGGSVVVRAKPITTMLVFILTLVCSLLVGLIVPAVIFEKKDKTEVKKPRDERHDPGDEFYALSRLGYLAWFFGSFGLVMLGVFVALLLLGALGIQESNTQAILAASSRISWSVSLMFISTRRLRDVKWSPWLCLLGIFYPLSVVWHIILMTVPGKRVPAEDGIYPRQATATTHRAIRETVSPRSVAMQHSEFLNLRDRGEIKMGIEKSKAMHLTKELPGEYQNELVFLTLLGWLSVAICIALAFYGGWYIALGVLILITAPLFARLRKTAANSVMKYAMEDPIFFECHVATGSIVLSRTA